MLIAVRHNRNQPHGLRRNVAEGRTAVGAELDHAKVRILHRIDPLLAPGTLRLACFTPIRDRGLSRRSVSKADISQDVFETLFDDNQGNVAETIRVFAGKAVRYSE